MSQKTFSTGGTLCNGSFNSVTMASRFEIVDEEYIEELKDERKNENTENNTEW